MTETQRRIKELKRSLPNMKEKVVAVAVLLALSLTMMASVSYAWYTLSFAPELGGVNTTVAANGNLEIALSGLDGLEPNASAVGDSSARDGQTILGANVTWGNMVNLSSGYGIESLVLRPAVLNPQSDTLLTGVKYSEDGRVEGAATDFGFTSWVLNSVTNQYHFGVPTGNAFGVRAVSSVGYPDGKGELQALLDKVEEKFTVAKNAYDDIMSNSEYISVIQNVVQVYLDDNVDAALNGGSEVNSDCTKYVAQLAAILDAFYYQAVCAYGDTLAELANVQQYFKDPDYDPYTRNDLSKAANNKDVNLSNSLSTYLQMERETYQDILKMQEFKKKVDDGTSVYWSDLEPIINRLIEINTVTVEGKTATQILAMGKKNILSYVMGLPSTVAIRIQGGNLRRFELLSGSRMNVTISFKISIISKKGNMKTNLTATDVSRYYLDVDTTKKMSNSATNKGKMVALETYGMVLDLWFRTNSGTSERETVLTLDGLPQIVTRMEPRMIILSGESESRPVYVYNRPTGQELNGIPFTEEILVYQAEDKNDIDQDKNTAELIYYDCSSYSPVFYAVVVTEKDAQGNDITRVEDTDKLLSDAIADGSVSALAQKMDKFEDVVGFTSSNRVWNDGELDAGLAGSASTLISSTQGSGSCYVFHADTPEAYASAVELLSHLKFAFMDANGGLLAEAALDVEHIFAESGKYTVPLMVINTTYETVNNAGETVYGIAGLKKNVAQRISVVVYLDGLSLENDMVMAKDSIIGGLNLQFSTVDDLRALSDTALQDDTISIRTEMANRELNFTGAALSEKLTAYVEGLNPSRVEAAFQRKINAFQGTQMDKVELTNTSGSVWEVQYPFKAPGTYVLTSLWIDGVEYNLSDAQKITVNVSGFAIEQVIFCVTEENMALTVNNSVSRAVSVKINTPVKPRKMEAILEEKNGGFVSAVLTEDSMGYWSGTAEFTSSGEYTIRYVSADGTYYEVPETMRKTFTAYLSLYTRIYLQRDDGLTFLLPDGEDGETVRIRAEILYGNDIPLMGLDDVCLFYHKRGSTVDGEGLTAELTWSNGYYIGEFGVNKGGIFNFDRLQIGTSDDNKITDAILAPAIIARDEKPVRYITSSAEYKTDGSSNATAGLLVMTDNSKVYYALRLANADTAENIRVDMIDPSGKIHTVGDPVFGANGYYYFAIPTKDADDNNISMHGVWKIDAIRMCEVYDSEGDYYGSAFDNAVAEEYVYRNRTEVTDSETGEVTVVFDPIYTFTVIKDFTVTLSTVKDANGEQGIVLNNKAQFLAAQNVSGITVSISAANNIVLEGIKPANVVLTLYHNEDSNTYGKYSFSGTNKHSTIVFQLKDNGDGTFSLPADAQVYLAGTYDWSLTYELHNEDNQSLVQVPYTVARQRYVTGTSKKVLTVYSESPTVTISSVDPGTDTPFNTTKINGSNITVVPNVYNYVSETRDYAVVYAKGTQSVLGYWSYSMPKVTLRLSGLATISEAPGNNAMTASLVMVNQDDTAITHAFDFSTEHMDGAGTMTSSSIIGTSASQSNTHDIKKLAGKTTFRAISIVCDDVTYNATLAFDVTIEQPEVPYTIRFERIPDQIEDKDKPISFATHGGRVEISLPTLSYVVRTELEAVYSEWTNYTVDTVLRTDYSTRNYKPWIGVGSWTQYTWYNWIRYVSTRQAYGTFSCQKVVLIGWSINGGTPVAPGTYVINVEGDMVITPVFENSGEPYVESETEDQATTEKRYIYGYEKDDEHVNVDTNTAGEGGEEIGNVTFTSITKPKDAPAPKTYPTNSYGSADEYKNAWP